MSAFKDHFSTKAAEYAVYRPTYPQALVDALAELAPDTGVALDVGCGNGQLSVLLAERFTQVIATDASEEQVRKATPHPRVIYRVARAEASGLPNVGVSLLTAAQAAHWFDLRAFYAEARRILKPRGVVALITYGVMQVDEAIDPVVGHFYREVIGPYWPPERRHVEDSYRSFDFPFEACEMPALAIEIEWSRDDLLGYVGTWSAVRGAEAALGPSPIEGFRQDLAAVWTAPDERRLVRFPISMRVGRA